MDMIDSTPDSEYYAAKSELPRGYVYVVPAFSGLGAPWYDSYARATIFGLHRGANKYDVIKATTGFPWISDKRYRKCDG